MSPNAITWVGMDAHKKSINVAMLVPGQKTPVEWQVANEPAAVRRLGRKLEGEAPGEVRCCYEAGPCGYALQRQLEAAGVICEVVAPSLIPFRPGERIKTDHRDARKLAELLRAGLLTEVDAPSEDEEAVRDLCRCREDAREDLTRVRHRLSKFLLRRGCIYDLTRTAWGQRHRQWLRGLRFERAADQAIFDDYLLAIEQVEERLNSLDARLGQVAEAPPYGEQNSSHPVHSATITTSRLHHLGGGHALRRALSRCGPQVVVSRRPRRTCLSDNPAVYRPSVPPRRRVTLRHFAEPTPPGGRRGFTPFKRRGHVITPAGCGFSRT